MEVGGRGFFMYFHEMYFKVNILNLRFFNNIVLLSTDSGVPDFNKLTAYTAGRLGVHHDILY